MSCLETYATLRIFSDDVHPERITELLGISPTETIPRDPSGKYRVRREKHLWRLQSRGAVASRDNLEHIGWILGRIAGKRAALDELRSIGCEIDVVNYFVSSGQGGPELDTPTIDALSQLGLSIWWDVYFGEESEYSDETKPGVGV